MRFEQSYVMSDKKIPPMSWDEYSSFIMKSYHDLLSTNPAEEIMQDFFERNPSFLPGAYGLQTKSGHAPMHSCLFSQPKLPGLSSKIPDFMWIAKNSDYIHPILIEIEAPIKKYFNQNDSLCNDFTQAQTQIIDWKSWFSDPANMLVFQREYAIDDRFQFNKRKIKPYFLLIYGRTNETKNSQSRSDRKANLAYEDEMIMTYDRLMPSHDESYYFCGKRTSDGYKMISFPEYLYLCPDIVEDMYRFNEKIESIKRNDKINNERKVFLIERIEYWMSWVEKGATGVRNMGDRE